MLDASSGLPTNDNDIAGSFGTCNAPTELSMSPLLDGNNQTRSDALRLWKGLRVRFSELWYTCVVFATTLHMPQGGGHDPRVFSRVDWGNQKLMRNFIFW